MKNIVYVVSVRHPSYPNEYEIYDCFSSEERARQSILELWSDYCFDNNLTITEANWEFGYGIEEYRPDIDTIFRITRTTLYS